MPTGTVGRASSARQPSARPLGRAGALRAPAPYVPVPCALAPICVVAPARAYLCSFAVVPLQH